MNSQLHMNKMYRKSSVLWWYMSLYKYPYILCSLMLWGGGGCIGMLACTEPRYRVFKAKFSFAKMSAINDDNVNNGTKSSQSLCFRENEKFLKTKFHINPTQTFPAMQIPELAIKFPKPIIIIMKLCIGRWPSLHGQDTSHHIWTQQRQSPIERQSPYCSMAAPIERQSVEWLSL